MFYLAMMFVLGLCLIIFRVRHGEVAEDAFDRVLSQQADNFRATWPIPIIALAVGFLSAFIMFFVPAPEAIKMLAITSFAASGVTLMVYFAYVLLNGLFR